MKTLLFSLILFIAGNCPVIAQYFGITWEKCLAGDIGAPKEFDDSRFALQCINCLNVTVQ